MNKNEGLKRLAKFVHYVGIGLALPVAYVGLIGEVSIGYLIASAVIYLIVKGISWIIEGFAKD